MDIRAKLLGEPIGQRFERIGKEAVGALRLAAQDAAQDIELKGRADISQAGNFGRRWIEGFHADVTEGGGHIRINVSEDVPYWTVFEFGAVIRGKSGGKSGGLLWIPLSPEYGGSEDAQGVWARDFPMPLFRVDSKKGTPLLFSWEPGVKDSARPQYFGKEQVTEPKKFHIRDIVRETVRRMQTFFSQHFRR